MTSSTDLPANVRAVPLSHGRRLLFDCVGTREDATYRVVVYWPAERNRSGRTVKPERRTTGRDRSLSWAIARALEKTAPDAESEQATRYVEAVIWAD